jgi:hypothetical protein
LSSARKRSIRPALCAPALESSNVWNRASNIRRTLEQHQAEQHSACPPADVRKIRIVWRAMRQRIVCLFQFCAVHYIRHNNDTDVTG